MKFSRTQRLVVSLLTSTCLFSQSSFGAVNGQTKVIFNTLVKEFTKTDLQSLVKNYGHFLDDRSLGFIESVLKKHPGAKIDSIRVEPLNDKKHPDAQRVTLSTGGATIQMEISLNDPENIRINGTRMNLAQLLDLTEASTLLSKTDVRFSEISKRVRGFQAPPSNRSTKEAAKLVRMNFQEKSEAFYILRKNQESVMEILNAASAKQVAANEEFFIHPLFASLIAQAANVNDFCGAGGNLSTYQHGRYTDGTGKVQTGLHCDPFRVGVTPPPTYHDKCQNDQPLFQNGRPVPGQTLGSVSGRKVSCPPLFYGGWKKGGKTYPHCQPADVADFTPNGTLNCNSMNPVKGEVGTAEYRQSTRKILEEYLEIGGGNKDEFTKCLNSDNKYNESDEKCSKLFKGYMDEFYKYKTSAMVVCNDKTEVKTRTKDFKNFCDELRKRSFVWESYTSTTPPTPGKPPVTAGGACETAGGKNEADELGVSTCYCEKSRPATQKADGSYEPCVIDIATACRQAGGTYAQSECKCKETGMPAIKKGERDFESCAAGVEIACANAGGNVVPDELGVKSCYCEKSRRATQKNDGSFESCSTAAVSESKINWPAIGLGALALTALWLFNRGGGNGGSKQTIPPYNPYPPPAQAWLEGNNGKVGGTGASGSVRSPSPSVTIPTTPATGTTK